MPVLSGGLKHSFGIDVAVAANGSVSVSRTVQGEVPQGSVLGSIRIVI